MKTTFGFRFPKAWIQAGAAGILILLVIGAFVRGGIQASREGRKLPSEMPPDFKFVMHCGHGGQDQFDTFKGTCQKDLVMDGLTSARLSLSDAEMRKIYAKLKEYEVLDFPAGISTATLNPVRRLRSADFYVNMYLKIQAGGIVKEVRWRGRGDTTNKASERFGKMVYEIFTIIEENEGYKKLPPRKGGYV